MFNTNIADLVKRDENVPNKQEILQLLKKYTDTNELVIATLAGSSKRVGEILKKGKELLNK